MVFVQKARTSFEVRRRLGSVLRINLRAGSEGGSAGGGIE